MRNLSKTQRNCARGNPLEVWGTESGTLLICLASNYGTVLKCGFPAYPAYRQAGISPASFLL